MLRGEGEEAKVDELQYVRMIGAKVEQDLITIREMFNIKGNAKKEAEISKEKQEQINASGMQEYFERWLNVVKELI